LIEDVARRLLAIKSHPKYFLKYATYTKDGNDLQNPCKAFPFHLPYHQIICDTWHENNLFICLKSRQMQMTWHMLASFLWLAITGSDREIYFRRQTMDDAQKLLEDTRFIYDHIPEHVWPRELLPEMNFKEGFMSFPAINSIIYAISSGRDKMRGRTPSGVLLDEFAFQDDAEMVFQTIKPSLQGGAKVSILSTPKPLFADEDPVFRRLFEDRI
jgi:phage FluMu gp28-like protein